MGSLRAAPEALGFDGDDDGGYPDCGQCKESHHSNAKKFESIET
jgi:hypothetical protein